MVCYASAWNEKYRAHLFVHNEHESISHSSHDEDIADGVRNGNVDGEEQKGDN